MDGSMPVAVFVVAWALIPILVITYRCSTVPRRYREIEQALLGNRPDASRKSAASYYAKLVAPFDLADASHNELESLIRTRFYDIQSWLNYARPLAFIALVLGLELAICERWVEAQLAAPEQSLSLGHVLEAGRIPLPIIMALLGGYVWTLYEVVSRKACGDLTPYELDDVVMRLVVAVPIGYAFSLIAIDRFQGAFAFTASAFPVRDVRRILRERALRQAPQVGETSGGRVRLTPMERVVGALGYETVARLQELQISTPTDIAFTDPIWLMVRVGFSVRHVLTWMDQALLAIYVGPQRPKLARLGIPCALDACEFYVAHCFNPLANQVRDCTTNPAVVDLAKQLDMTVPLLIDMLKEIYGDPHVRFVAEAWDPEAARDLYPL